MIEQETTPRVTDLEAFLRASLNEGGSGRGLTFWSDAAECGKRALYNEERRARWREDPSTIPPFDPDKKTAFAVGGVYHKLHELWAKGKLDDELIGAAGPFYDASGALAWHLFMGWREHWPKDFWGKDVAIEQTLPVGDYAEREISAELGEVVNAKPDRVVWLEEEELERARQRCPELISRGYYMLDHKTTGGDYDEIYYREGLQNYWYPVAWELDNPDKPLQGFIYDIIRKPNPRAKDQAIGPHSFHAVFIPRRERAGALDVVRGVVPQGRENIQRARDKGLGNRSQCVSIGFGKVEVCPFFHRECDGR